MSSTLYHYSKSSIKPLGLIQFCTLQRGAYERGELFRKGGLFKKLDEEDIYDYFISLLTRILRIQDAILRVKYINLADFYPKLYQNSHAKVFKQSRKKILGNL